MAQVESSIQEFERRKTRVIFIAAQKRDGLFRGKKFVDEHPYSFPILFDEDRSVTRAYGVHHALGVDAVNIARRSIFLVDGEGTIRWIAVSPRQTVAPSIQDILWAIAAYGKC